MKRTLLLVVICFVAFAGTAALADETSHKKAVLRLLEVTYPHHNQPMKPLEDAVMQRLDALTVELPPEARLAARNEIRKWFSENLSMDQLRDTYVELYTQVFAEDEINELIQLNQAPLGKKIVKKMPEFFQAIMQKAEEISQRKCPELQEKIDRTIAALEARYRAEGRSSQEAPPKISGQGANGQKSPLSREERWGVLIGTWFGSRDNSDGGKYMYITEKRRDGTYKVRFRTVDLSGKKEEKVEIGKWVVCGDVYFQIYKADIKGDKIAPADVTDPANRDAYKILKLTNELFEYEGLDSGNRYTAKKVAAGFTFPE